MGRFDNEDRHPSLQEGNVSAARGEPPAGTKFCDAAYCVENSNYGNTKHFGTGKQIEKNIIDTKAHVLCLQECTEQHVERLRQFRGQNYNHNNAPRGSGDSAYPNAPRPEEELDRSFWVVHSLEQGDKRNAICVCKSHFEGIRLERSVLTCDGTIRKNGKNSKCSSRILVATAQFKTVWMQNMSTQCPVKSKHLRIANMHFHFATAKKEAKPEPATKIQHCL